MKEDTSLYFSLFYKNSSFSARCIFFVNSILRRFEPIWNNRIISNFNQYSNTIYFPFVLSLRKCKRIIHCTLESVIFFLISHSFNAITRISIIKIYNIPYYSEIKNWTRCLLSRDRDKYKCKVLSGNDIIKFWDS